MGMWGIRGVTAGRGRTANTMIAIFQPQTPSYSEASSRSIIFSLLRRAGAIGGRRGWLADAGDGGGEAWGGGGGDGGGRRRTACIQSR